MTTIACTAQVMAADSYATDVSISSVRKIWRMKSGILGVAGPFCYGIGLHKYLIGEGSKPVVKDLTALFIDGKRIWCYDECLEPYIIEDPFASIGSGSLAALAAMDTGCTPREAVIIASKFDPYTGGKVRTLEM